MLFTIGLLAELNHSLMTATICTPLEEMNTGKYTHVLAMGKSTEDHTPVIEYYHREVKN